MKKKKILLLTSLATISLLTSCNNDKKLDSINVALSKTAYEVTDIIKPNDFVVTANYSNKTQERVFNFTVDNLKEEGYVFSESDVSSGKTFTVNYSFRNINKSKTISVSVVPFASWVISGDRNVDIETGATFTTNSINSITWDIDENSKSNGISIKDGKLTIPSTLNKSVSSTIIATDIHNVTKKLDVEVASFSKIDKSQLKNGKAYKLNDEISGRLAIPSYYYLDNDIRIEVSEFGSGEYPEVGFNNTNITSVYIPKTFTTIIEGAFDCCKSLSKVNSDTVGEFVIGDNITSIEKYAFSNCYEMTSLKLGSSLTSIPNFAFKCDKRKHGKLKEIKFNNSGVLKSIGSSAFANQFSKESYPSEDLSLILPEGLENISSKAFACESEYSSKTYGRIVNISFPSTIYNIGANAFKGHDSLTTVSYADTKSTWSITENKNGTPYHYLVSEDPKKNATNFVNYFSCIRTKSNSFVFIKLQNPNENECIIKANENKDLEGDIVIPTYYYEDDVIYRVTEIAQGAFAGQSKITSIFIPFYLYKIGDRAFINCTSLTSVFFINSGFWQVDNKYFDLRESATNISDPVVAAKLLTSSDYYEKNWEINLTASDNNYFDFVKLDASGEETQETAVSYGIKAKSGAAMPKQLVIPSTYDSKNVTKIMENGFSHRKDIDSIYIPSTVTTIANQAFCNDFVGSSVDEGALSIVIDEGIKTIGQEAFQAINAKSIYIPSSLESLGYNSFNASSFLHCFIANEYLVKLYNDDEGNNLHCAGGLLFNENETLYILDSLNYPSEDSVIGYEYKTTPDYKIDGYNVFAQKR